MIHRYGDSTHFFEQCFPWCPQGDGRASLVAGNVAGSSRFLFDPDGTPVRKSAPQPSSAANGRRLALARLTRLASSSKVRAAVFDVRDRDKDETAKDDEAKNRGREKHAGAAAVRPDGAERLQETGDTYFRCDGPEYLLSFLARDRPPEDATLMHFRTFNEEKFLAISAWLGERQHLWPEWRRIAEEVDGQELGRHLASLYTLPALEEFLGAEMVAQREEEPEVTIAVLLTTRRLDVLRHRFPTLELRDAFLGWLDEGNPTQSTQALALLGLLEGRSMLARHMDAVAKAQLHAERTGGSSGATTH